MIWGVFEYCFDSLAQIIRKSEIRELLAEIKTFRLDRYMWPPYFCIVNI